MDCTFELDVFDIWPWQGEYKQRFVISQDIKINTWLFNGEINNNPWR